MKNNEPKMKKKLFDEFSPIHKQEWFAQAAKDLKDENIAGALMTNTFEGVSIPAFFNHEDRGKANWLQSFESRFQYPSPNMGGGARSWSNLVSVNGEDGKKANQEIKKVLEYGADGVILELSGKEDLSDWLDGVYPGGVSIWLKAKEAPVAVMRQFFRWSDQLGVPQNKVVGGLIWDPFVSAFEKAKTKKAVERELMGIHEASIPYPHFKGLTLNFGVSDWRKCCPGIGLWLGRVSGDGGYSDPKGFFCGINLSKYSDPILGGWRFFYGNGQTEGHAVFFNWHSSIKPAINLRIFTCLLPPVL